MATLAPPTHGRRHAATRRGRCLEHRPPSHGPPLAVTLAGFVTLALTFFLLGPFGTPAWGWGGPSDGLQDSLNNMPSVASALVFKGIGSALSNNAIYPDLVMGLPADDVMLMATISGLWNAAYAIGWAVGPLVGGGLYDLFLDNALCIGKAALPPTCPISGSPQPHPHHGNHSHHAHSPPPPPPLSPKGADCLCDWAPHNGFDGFSSVIVIISLTYAAVLAVAVLLDVRGGAPSVRTTQVEPLPTSPEALVNVAADTTGPALH